MVKTIPFIDAQTALSLRERVLQNNTLFRYRSEKFAALGYSYDDSEFYQEARDLQKIKSFNDFAARTYPELLQKTLMILKDELKENVFLDERISYPGFHILTIDPHSKFTGYFHRDAEYAILKKEFPEYEIGDGQQLSFTVLIDLPERLTAGLKFFESDHPVIKKVGLKQALVGYEDFASLYRYEPGTLNYHSNPYHTIYAENSGDEKLLRITYQGHLVKTNKGWIVFW